MIKYLIKFVSEKKYAEILLDGGLFMRCTHYYQELEKKEGCGQGDLSDGIAIHGEAVYMNSFYPIFCMYSVDEGEIIRNKWKVKAKVIQDFKCENGYSVIIDYEKFEKALYNLDCQGYKLRARKVNYGIPNLEFSKKLICDDSADNLFLKNPYFAHQNEYRIVVFKDMYNDIENEDEKRKLKVDDLFETFHLQENIRDYAKCFSIASLKREADDYIFDLEDLQ